MRSKSTSFEASGHESRTRSRPTKSHTCTIGEIYPANKEEVARVALKRNLEQSLQHVGVHYPTESWLQE
ncbi:hypothetical protein TNCV_1555941 [Trichonephila clavipes]|nr:hypothetical protein TNCV_1555941 [Trichonephila clavipes]